MHFTKSLARCLERADRPSNPNFARQATIDAFGWRFAKTLDQAGFIDRLPWESAKPSPEARSAL